MKNGFDPALLYQVVFTAKDPMVLGVGLSQDAGRRLFLQARAKDKDDTGTANPVAGKIAYSITQGSSQSGNFIRSMIHLGFNEDETGKIVWDGAMPHIAGRQLPLNVRFSLPDGASDAYEMGSEGVLWWGDWTDKAPADAQAGRVAGPAAA